MKLTIEISEKSWELLKKLQSVGYAEFRDNRYKSVEEWKEKQIGEPDIEYFYRRNFCDLNDLVELIDLGFIKENENSWHLTYLITTLGHKILEQNIK